MRANIRAMAGYTPGEQPQDGEYLKLNTNESPYPPTPAVQAALHAAITGDSLRKYPDPLGSRFRRTAGRVLGVDPESILIGNGSDDILTILTRAFVPEGGHIVSMTPSYLLYRTLAEIQGARFSTVPFTSAWRLPSDWPIGDANLTLIANPNSPTGTAIPPQELAKLPERTGSTVVIDEAYADYADDNALTLACRPGIVVTRTLSKGYSLAGIRFGFAVTAPEIVRELVKVKDSYNCDVLSLAAAEAALADQENYRLLWNKIRATREQLTQAVRGLGFAVLPSQANFVWCQHERPVKPIYQELKARKILVRYMTYPGFGEGLRITVGTEEQTARLVSELQKLL